MRGAGSDPRPQGQNLRLPQGLGSPRSQPGGLTPQPHHLPSLPSLLPTSASATFFHPSRFQMVLTWAPTPHPTPTMLSSPSCLVTCPSRGVCSLPWPGTLGRRQDPWLPLPRSASMAKWLALCGPGPSSDVPGATKCHPVLPSTSYMQTLGGSQKSPFSRGGNRQARAQAARPPAFPGSSRKCSRMCSGHI